jgi:hypothetical protein
MSEFIAAILFTLLLVGGPIALVSYETTKAVNKTTIECIEKPNICKDRYEYIKLGDKLDKIKFEESTK